MSNEEKLRKTVRRETMSGSLIALALCIMLTAACLLSVPDREAAPVAEQRSFLELVPEGFGTPVSVTITGPEGCWTLSETEDGYMLEGQDSKLDEGRAQTLLSCGASVLAREKLNGDPEDFGLGAGAIRAEFTDADGGVFTLMLGNAPATGEGRYAMTDDGRSICVVNASLYSMLSVSPVSLIALPDLSAVFTAQTLLSVRIEQKGMETITINRVEEANPFNTVAEFIEPVRYPANSERTAELFLALEALVPKAVLEPEGSLEDPFAVLTLTGPEETVILRFERTDDVIRMCIDGSPVIYLADQDALEFLGNASVPYLAEQLPALVALNNVSGVRLMRGDTVYELRMDADKCFLNTMPIEYETFTSLYQRIIGLLIDRYVPDNRAGEAMAEFEFTLKDGSVWTLAFSDHDAETLTVVRGDAECFLMRRSKLDAVFDAFEEVEGT